MARIDTSPHSDDDFDLLYEVESVSELSDAQDARGPPREDISLQQAHATNSERLSGPHEIPVLPHAETSAQDDLSSTTRQLSIANDDASPNIQRSESAARSKGNFVNDGLQYTKSVYNKLWNKDALIAVMG